MIVVVLYSDDRHIAVEAEQPGQLRQGADSFLQLLPVERWAVILKH